MGTDNHTTQKNAQHISVELPPWPRLNGGCRVRGPSPVFGGVVNNPKVVFNHVQTSETYHPRTPRQK